MGGNSGAAVSSARPQRKTIAERFARYLSHAESGCIEWVGTKDTNGYGILTIEKMPIKAHRVAWQLVHGDIPNRLHVLHSCDNPSCVNVAHLSLGTHRDNMRDMTRKGRRAPSHQSGEACHLSKLTVDQVRDIRRRALGGESQSSIGRVYGVGCGHVGDIVKGRVWRGVN